MLQKIRDNITGWFASLFLAVIAIVFVFWGIQFESAPDTYAAKVNGQAIPLQAVRDAWQSRRAELMQQTRDELPAEIVASEQQEILSDFVRRELLIQRTEELGYRVSDGELAEMLNGIPALQVDGRFSRDRYAALLRQQGRTEAQFEDQFRRDLEATQLRNGIAISSFATPNELQRRARIEGEQRDLDYIKWPVEGFMDQVSVKPEDAKSYYDEHKNEFVSAEAVTLKYVLLKLSDIEAEVEVSEEALHAFYDEVAAARFVAPERRRASHILIESGEDDSAARERAEALIKMAQAGEDFSNLARENSDDPGSKEQGGDLGWATRESFVPQFSEALFGMTSSGEIVGPVKTPFGYHVIRLDGIEVSRQRTFDEVRAELEAEYRTEKAQSIFYDRRERLADEAFSALNELDSVAANLGMALQTVEEFTREGGGPFGNDRKVIDVAFSEAVMDEGQNSPAIGIGDDQVVVLRVSDHRPPAQESFEAVKGDVDDLLRRKAAAEAARAAAAAALARLEAGEDLAAVAKPLGLETAGKMTVGRYSDTVPPALLTAVFSTVSGASGKGLATLANGDVALFVVDNIRPGSLPAAAEMPVVAQQVAGMTALAEFGAYARELESVAEVTLNKSVFE